MIYPQLPILSDPQGHPITQPQSHPHPQKTSSMTEACLSTPRLDRRYLQKTNRAFLIHWSTNHIQIISCLLSSHCIVIEESSGRYSRWHMLVALWQFWLLFPREKSRSHSKKKLLWSIISPERTFGKRIVSFSFPILILSHPSFIVHSTRAVEIWRSLVPRW